MTDKAAAIHHTLSAAVIAVDWRAEVRSLRNGEAYQRADHSARTVAKQGGLRVVLVAMRAGGQMEEHHTDAAISVHCLEGSFTIEVEGAVHHLADGRLLAVAARLPHRVVAIEECAFLLTVGHAHLG